MFGQSYGALGLSYHMRTEPELQGFKDKEKNHRVCPQSTWVVGT